MISLELFGDLSAHLDGLAQSLQGGVSRSTVTLVTFSSGSSGVGLLKGDGLRWPVFSGDEPSGVIDTLAFRTVTISIEDGINFQDALEFSDVSQPVAQWITFEQVSATLAFWSYDLEQLLDDIDRDGLAATGGGDDDFLRPGDRLSLAGDDEIRLNGGDDLANGGKGADLIKGGGGADTLQGGRGGDTLEGGGGADAIEGGAGQDLLRGRAGNDVMKGGAGRDVLVGAGGRDTLSGGASNDDLTGGRGADTFEFTGKVGHDVVQDFSGADQLMIGRGAAGMSARKLIAAADVTDDGVLLTLKSGSILLEGLRDTDGLDESLTVFSA